MPRPRKVRAPREELIPPRLPRKAWRMFFVAARTMVARRERKDSALLKFWDRNAKELSRGLDSQTVTHRAYRAFNALIRIMEGNVTPHPCVPDWLTLYGRAREVLANRARIRQDSGNWAKYTPLKAKWAQQPANLPDQPIQTDSPAFYRIALSQVFSEAEMKPLTDGFLQNLLSFKNKPAQETYEVLGKVYRCSPHYIAQRISDLRRLRREPLRPRRDLGKRRPGHA